MDKQELENIISRILDIQNAVSDLKDNTRDAEMVRYFMGFEEALDWVVCDVLRMERVRHKMVVTNMSSTFDNEKKPFDSK